MDNDAAVESMSIDAVQHPGGLEVPVTELGDAVGAVPHGGAEPAVESMIIDAVQHPGGLEVRVTELEDAVGAVPHGGAEPAVESMSIDAVQHPGGLEVRVTVPGGGVTVEHDAGPAARAWTWLATCVAMVYGFCKNTWKLGAEEPRKAVHAVKVGLAVILASLFFYTNLYQSVSKYAIWAVMTVPAVFEYTVGGSVYKGINRVVATASAGVIAVDVDSVAGKSGDNLYPVITCGSLFFVAAVATFARFIPSVKARVDYGLAIFIEAYCLLAASAYHTEKTSTTLFVRERVVTVTIGVFICLAVCVLIWPVWDGQELHLLTVRNMEKIAGAVEGCVVDYFSESDYFSDVDAARRGRVSSVKSELQGVLDSEASENSKANLACWEPPHGMFAFRHPYAHRVFEESII